MAAGAEDFDYDKLARRLLVQVVQRLATAPADVPEPPAASSPAAGTSGPPGEEPAPGDAALARTVENLEHKLASVRTRQRKLTEENAQLREQLRAAQESLVRAQEHADSGRIAGQLDSAEAGLLERLLSPLRDRGDRGDRSDRHEEAGAADAARPRNARLPPITCVTGGPLTGRPGHCYANHDCLPRLRHIGTALDGCPNPVVPLTRGARPTGRRRSPTPSP